jgi:hypothetical protein
MTFLIFWPLAAVSASLLAADATRQPTSKKSAVSVRMLFIVFRDDARAALSWAQNNDRVCALTAVLHLATVAALKNLADTSARLMGFVDQENQDLARTIEIPERICLQILDDALGQQLSSNTIIELKEDGRRLQNDEAIELALSV